MRSTLIFLCLEFIDCCCLVIGAFGKTIKKVINWQVASQGGEEKFREFVIHVTKKQAANYI
jgi:hypothetical protein